MSVRLSLPLAASLALLTTATFLSKPATAGLSCMADHWHFGSTGGKPAPTRKRALAAAIASWSSFTIWEYGRAFGSFKIAQDKTVSCERRGGKQWVCNVSGRPCRRT